MKYYGKQIFYCKLTGNVLLTTGDMMCTEGRPPTFDEAFEIYKPLKDRERDSVGLIEFSYGEGNEDFVNAISWAVDLTTGKLIFAYKDENNSEDPPTFRPSLSDQVISLQAENTELKSRLEATESALLTIMDKMGGGETGV